MNKKTRIALVAATLGLTAAGHAENGGQLFKDIMSQTNHTLIPLLEWRARYEFGEQDGSEASHAATMRARVGLQSQDYSGFSGLLEFEATRHGNQPGPAAVQARGPPGDRRPSAHHSR